MQNACQVSSPNLFIANGVPPTLAPPGGTTLATTTGRRPAAHSLQPTSPDRSLGTLLACHAGRHPVGITLACWPPAACQPFDTTIRFSFTLARIVSGTTLASLVVCRRPATKPGTVFAVVTLRNCPIKGVLMWGTGISI